MDNNKIQDLIGKAKLNDKQAFGLLVTEFQYPVYCFVLRLLNNDNEAKDIVQETFIKTWLKIHKYNANYKFITWLYKIASNLCYDRLRSKKYKNQRVDISLLNIQSLESADSKIENKELIELIMFFTESLTPKQKIVFTLKDIEGIDTTEIENITGLSAYKIKSNLYLARKFIKSKIEKHIK